MEFWGKNGALGPFSARTKIGNNQGTKEPNWRLLNASYVLEFFLQTLVRAKFMRQAHMLVLNALLQVSASCFALPVALAFVSPHASVLSLALNFAQVGNEPARVLLAALLAASAPRPFA